MRAPRVILSSVALSLLLVGCAGRPEPSEPDHDSDAYVSSVVAKASAGMRDAMSDDYQTCVGYWTAGRQGEGRACWTEMMALQDAADDLADKLGAASPSSDLQDLVSATESAASDLAGIELASTCGSELPDLGTPACPTALQDFRATFTPLLDALDQWESI